MKICKKCIQPDSRPGIFFDDNGICGACLWENEKENIDWELRYKELENISQWAKKNSKGNYDCAIGVSGGKDSTKQAITAKEELNLNCLLVNYEPENITELGKENIENLKNLGFDVITIRPNPKVMKNLIYYDFFNHLNPVKVTEFSLYSSTYIIAEKFNIPLIIQGENPGLTLGTSLTGVGKDADALKAEQLQTLSKGWKEYLKIDKIDEKDLFLFHYNRKKLEDSGTKGIWLQYFLKEWSYRGNAEFSKSHGLKYRENINPEEIGTYIEFAQLDSDLVHVNQMLKFVKFGFGQCLDHACYDFRDGKLSRNEAIEIVLKLDGKCGQKYIDEFCSYLDLTKDVFLKTIEKFRGDIWYTENGVQKNKFHEMLNELKDTK